MAVTAGVGLSKRKEDSYQAGLEACQTAIKHMGGGTPDFTITFASVAFDQAELVRGVQEASHGASGVGCTDAGEITGAGPSEKSVAVMAIASDQIHFTTGLSEDIKGGARAAGAAVAKGVQGAAPAPLRTFIMLPDVLVGNGADIVRGVLEVLGEHFPVVGGAAGDDFLFKKTYEYHDGRVVSGAVAGVGLSGTFTFAMGVRHGWVPIGVPMKVTKSDGAVLHELDHRPAVSIYEDYFGAEAEALRREPLARMAITYPLGLKVPDLDEYLIRDPITVDEHGAITCAAEIPEGSEVRLMIGSKERAVEAAEDAAHHMMRDFEAQHSSPKLLLMFNCIAREKLFAQKAKDEIDAIMRIVGPEVPLLGFYTYGEQAPMGGETREAAKIQSRFYNETVVLFGIGE
ncbi:MAG: FIST N-terminal domain-containing protein [bacterium]|nr:FIST N-terminal domain-containing protein [bacterium]